MDTNLVEFTTDLNQEFQANCALSNLDSPWFGRFTIKTDKRNISYKIGDRGNPVLHIIDWRHPLSKGYLESKPGEDFELDEDQYNFIEGEILQHIGISNKDREIHHAIIKNADGIKHELEAKDGSFVFLDEVSARFRSVDGLPDIRSLLTKDQYNLITKSSKQPVIIQGQAGSGKTTVALYRASWLTYPDVDSASLVEPKNILIVMFNKALQSFVKSTLEPLGLESANVLTFHAWALHEVKRAYNGKIVMCIDSFEGEEVARNIKKQIGLLAALDEFVQIQTDRLYQWVEKKLEPYNAQEWIDQMTQSNQPIAQRLIGLRKASLAKRDQATGLEKDQLEQIHILFAKAVSRLTLYKEELLNFFKNKELLKKHLPHVSDEDLEIVSQYQQALQGKDGSSKRPGPYISFDDLALVLRLIELKNGGFPDKDHDEYVNLYDHLVVDEAQDFGALEMSVLLSAVKTRSGVTIVGDTNQKIIPEADFMGWDRLADQLGIEGATVSKLEVAHRSTKPIMDLARNILNESFSEGRSGAKPHLTIAENSAKKIECLVSSLNNLILAAPDSHICVVCRHSQDAKLLFEDLHDQDIDSSVRLGHNKNFKFTSGVTITNLNQVKGLEFDSVILLDPSEENYPNNDQGKKYLYTVITRAKEQVFMIGDCEPTLLLKPAIKDLLLEVNNQLEVTSIIFEDEDDEPF